MANSVEIIAADPPRFMYRRFHPWLVRLGKILDLIIGRAQPGSSTSEVSGYSSILIMESHLIGDGVMTIAFINSIKNKSPQAKITLLAQRWMEELLPPGLVDEYIPCHLPWVGKGKFSVQKWRSFFHALRRAKKNGADLACETRGDWRNFVLLWLLRIPTRVGVPLSGGAAFLTHRASMIKLSDPLYATRISLLRCLGIDSDLILPEPPESKIPQVRPEPFVILHPGASQPHRRMSEQQLSTVFNKIPSNISSLFVAAGPEEFGLQMEFIERIEKLGLPAKPWSGGLTDFVSLCAKSELVFTMDSGPAHLAAWSGASTVVFCNHDAPEVIRPLTRQVASHFNSPIKNSPLTTR